MSYIQSRINGRIKVYHVRTNVPSFGYSVDTLKVFKYRKLNDDSMSVFLKSATPLKEGASPVWMGHYVATCTFQDKEERKVILSVYGGFFYDPKIGNTTKYRSNCEKIGSPILTTQ